MRSGLGVEWAFGSVFFLPFVVVVALVVTMVNLTTRGRRHGDQELRAFVAAQGWSYRPSAPELARRWSGPPFAGRSGVTSKAISGLFEGLPFTGFEYSYTVGSGDHQSTHHDAVVTIGLPATLPLLWVLPQTTENKLTNPLGSHDIDFESAQFNEAFMVTADNDRYAYSVMHPRMMELLLGWPSSKLPIRIEGNHAIAWAGGRLGPRELLDVLRFVAAFVKLIPGHAYDQHVAAAAVGYSGSVSGLRPEATPADLVRTGLVLIWGLVLLGANLPSMLPGNNRFGSFPEVSGIFVVVGLIVVGVTVVKLIRGWIAIGLNKRERNRQNGSQSA